MHLEPFLSLLSLWWMKVKNFKTILNSLSTWNNQHSHMVSEFKRTCVKKKYQPQASLLQPTSESPDPSLALAFQLGRDGQHSLSSTSSNWTCYMWVLLAPAFTYDFYTKNLFGRLGDVTVEHVAHHLPSFFERANEATHIDNSPPNPSPSFSQRISWCLTMWSHMIYWIYLGDLWIIWTVIWTLKFSKLSMIDI